MSIRTVVASVVLSSALTAAHAQSPADTVPATPAPPAAGAAAKEAPAGPPPSGGDKKPTTAQPSGADASKPPDADGARPGAEPAKGADRNGPTADKPRPQKESGWYTGRIYSFNLLNVEYYDLNTKDLHFSGQRRDIDSDWAGLADLLTRSKGMGFVQINRKFVNLRNLSAIHDLGGGRGATLTFRDGATLKITDPELRRLIEVTQ